MTRDILITFISCLVIGLVPATGQIAPVIIDDLHQWKSTTSFSDATVVMKAPEVGDQYDLMGPGALLLDKQDTQKKFWQSTKFNKKGSWVSDWIPAGEDVLLDELHTEMLIYGKHIDMNTGWVKFSGNPLICPYDYKDATDESLQLPEFWSDVPNDQSLVKGQGSWEGKWLLVFGIGGWAKKGWGAVVADSLAPLKRGINPFTLAQPYPLTKGTLGNNAPNDWIFAEGLWYAPDETRGGNPHMWTSPDFINWTNAGEIKGIKGHDPGMVFDGETYYLFNENKKLVDVCTSTSGLGPWSEEWTVLEKEDRHTGDVDVDYFNNRWHMVFDDNTYKNGPLYTLGYAWSSAEDFPDGWQQNMVHDFFGPKKPDQGQTWDEWESSGNKFGTGDGDFAVEGTTLYLTYERPTGIAYRELTETMDGKNQKVLVKIESDVDGDGQPDGSTGWLEVSPGKNKWKESAGLKQLTVKKFRISYKLATSNKAESPLIKKVELHFKAANEGNK